MPIEKLRPSFLFDEERIKELKKIAPEAFADGKINWEVLKEVLGEYLEDESGEVEHFGLFWPGKKDARKIASIPSKGTLVPVFGEGLKADGTPDSDGLNDSRNIFIEGENLEVLKILQKSYAGRIKMIYIDPPYNTGNDFVYEDDFKEPLLEYLRRTGQTDEEGRPLTTNTRADGRFHSKWLSMMYPRLRLARNLLRDDGVIFVSIDDNEVHHLRMMMNEIFGEENFVGVIKRRASRKTAHLSGTMSDMCDYIVIFSQTPLNEPLSIENASDNTRPVFNKGNKITERKIPLNTIAKCKDGVYPKGIYKVKSLEFEVTDDLVISNGRTQNEITVKGPWRINQNIINKTIYVTKNFGFRRYLLPEEYEIAKAMNDLLDEPEFYNEIGSEELKDLFEAKEVFNNPKPNTLIKFLINASDTSKEENDFIVLDFFAGSCSTGHALYAYLNENINHNNKKYILVQIPEPCDEESEAYKAGYKNIAEIGKERIRRVVKRIKENTPSDKLINQDLGFKSFKLSTSNFKDWNNLNEHNLNELQDLFEKHVSSTVEGSKAENLIAEIMLLEGFTLDSTIKRIAEFKANDVKLISSELNDHQLVVCLDEKIEEDTIDKLTLGEKDIFICLDTAISDQAKLRLSDKGLIKTI